MSRPLGTTIYPVDAGVGQRARLHSRIPLQKSKLMCLPFDHQSFASNATLFIGTLPWQNWSVIAERGGARLRPPWDQRFAG